MNASSGQERNTITNCRRGREPEQFPSGRHVKLQVMVLGVMDYRQFQCEVDGCGRSFARKEHLARHNRTHNAANLHTCHVCSRKFNRSDSLLRHLAKHGNVFKPSPSGRSKRACLNCHTGKTKCDGNEKCSTCVKRGIECRYRTQDGEPRTSSLSIALDDQMHRQGTASICEQEQELPRSPGSNVIASHLSSRPDENTSVATTQHKILNSAQFLGATGLVDWSAVKFRDDTGLESSQTLDSHLERHMDPTSERYLLLYYSHFHHRWPIIHRPSLEDEDLMKLAQSSMVNIGAWLEGSPQTKELALESNKRLVEEITSQLSRITRKDEFQQSLSACLCQAALLNIIFGLYTGLESMLSRAMMLRSLLTTVLRDVGFFDPDSVWSDEREEFFLPFRMVKQHQRIRMAACLFKIDAYLSLIYNQPAMLMAEELHYGLQNAFALWDADGLPTWERRQKLEPLSRSDKSLFSMINEIFADSILAREYPILIEDIHLYMCSIQHSIWNVSDHGQNSSDCEISIILQKDPFRRRLDSLKEKIDRIKSQSTGDVEFGQEAYVPYRHYFGYEDHAQSGWQKKVTGRVDDLLFDSLMLYNLFSLHLHAEISILTNFAKDQSLDPVRVASQRHQHARTQRQVHVTKWIDSPTARQALCHAVEVLHAHQILTPNPLESLLIAKHTLDPVAYAALSTGALVIWAYSTFSRLGCASCSLESHTDSRHVIELTNWMSSSAQLEKEKETWIERGAAFPARLHGIELCKCNAELLTNLFRMYLPPDWELANVIAPGLFQSQEGLYP